MGTVPAVRGAFLVISFVIYLVTAVLVGVVGAALPYVLPVGAASIQRHRASPGIP